MMIWRLSVGQAEGRLWETHVIVIVLNVLKELSVKALIKDNSKMPQAVDWIQ